jgi:hypothetical protein
MKKNAGKGYEKTKPKQTQFLYHWLRLLFMIAAMC